MADSSFWGSGWSFPPTFEAANYQLNLVHKEDNINQSIDIIFSTRRGERSLSPSFGSDLSAYLFGNMDSTLKGEIINSVKACLLEHEPRIVVEQVEVDFVDATEITNLSESVSAADIVVNISISYMIKKTNSRHNYVYPFHLNEGSNLAKIK